ncbi:hypothetical protein PR048_026446 [Dryococelus australis]|uniref:Peptidase A2 domain-containing protein n=1 Tax=Dryococelus australis TaxID=614101 RepID=A0ABQ9GLD3_9NEOP|nr:hypothetical protein PR048_026446 [Dryococelus australis]
MAENSVSLKPPKHLSLLENGMPMVWKSWIQQFEWYAIAINMESKTQAVQVATFIAIGPDAANIFIMFSLSEAESKNPSVIKPKFDAYLSPKTNITDERYMFSKITQAEGKSFDDFLTLVVNQGKKCKFGELYNSLLHDNIVVGVCSDTVREKHLAEEALTFDKMIKICRASEITKLQVMRGDTLLSVHAMHISHKKITSELQKTEFKTRSKCPKCGYNHSRRTCPAVGKECKKCSKVGQFAKVRRSKQVLTVNSGQQGRTPQPSSSETFFVSSIDIHHKELGWTEKLTLPNGNSVSFKLDTGAQCNVLSSLFAQRALTTMRPSKTKVLVSFNKYSVPGLGEVYVKVFANKNTSHLVTFLIIDKGYQCILGRETCENLGFIERTARAIFDGEVFDGIGCLKGFMYDIDLFDQSNLHI